jgi:LacI family transcriptional regulator
MAHHSVETTQADVARLAGVSSATVSYVVNGGPRNVSDQTRSRVLGAIERLNYHPSGLARSLRTNRTRSIGFIVSDILNPVTASIVRAVEDLLAPQEHTLTVCNSDESSERELTWLRMLLSRRVDGVLIFPTGANLGILQAMLLAGRQVIQLGRRIEELRADSVLIDGERAAYEAVHHLIGMGHRRIGLVNIPDRFTPGLWRANGYARALHEAGIGVDPSLLRESGIKGEGAREMAAALLDLSPPPTALFVASNVVAHGVFEEVKERGLRVPEDLAVCVFDDVRHYSYMTPSITAVALDVKRFADEAVRLLFGRLGGTLTGEPSTVLVPCTLRVRESTGGPTSARQSSP